MMAPAHRVWSFTALAWLVMVAIPTTVVSIQWELGIGRDEDIHHVGELIFTFLVVLTLPVAALAFGVFAPMAVAIDRTSLGGRSRPVNLAIGAGLSIPALVVSVLVVTLMDRQAIADVGLWASLADAFSNPRLPAAFLMYVPGGMIVALGLRTRANSGVDSP